jgi:hypothetical protein
VVLLDERLILPVEKAAVEARGGKPPATTALGLHKYDFYSLSVGKLTDDDLIGKLVPNDTKVSRDTLVQLFCLFLVRHNQQQV